MSVVRFGLPSASSPQHLREHPADLFALCRGCHSLFHEHRRIVGANLHEINPDRLRMFLESNPETAINTGTWFLARDRGLQRLIPTRNPSSAISTIALCDADLDLLLAEFNTMQLAMRRRALNAPYILIGEVRRILHKHWTAA